MTLTIGRLESGRSLLSSEQSWPASLSSRSTRIRMGQPAWDAELSRRVAEIKSGQVIGRPAAEVYSDLRKKYS